MLASVALTENSRATLTVATSVLVALGLGVIIQGRVIADDVDPPAHLRPHLVAAEIIAAGVFFVAAATGVYLCLYYLAADRTPDSSDGEIIRQSLLTTALVAFGLTIARRALPACWPRPADRPTRLVLSRVRVSVVVSIMAVVVAASTTVIADAPRRLLIVALLAVLVSLFLLAQTWFDRCRQAEARLAAKLAGGAWTRVRTRPVKRGELDGAQELPVGFMLLTTKGDRQLWLSAAGIDRLRLLLGERGRGEGVPMLRWVDRRRREILWCAQSRPGASHIADAVLISRNDSGLFAVEPTLGLIERAPQLWYG